MEDAIQQCMENVESVNDYKNWGF